MNYKEIKQIVGNGTFMIAFEYFDHNTSSIIVDGRDYPVTNKIAKRLFNESIETKDNRFVREMV